jgi:hypothetical protein
MFSLTTVRRGAFVCAFGICLFLALFGSACHKKPQPGTPNAGQPPAATNQQPPAPPVEDIQDRTNPMPTGETWVHTDKLEYRIGETIKIQYKLKRSGSGKPWLGLIPIQVTAQDEGTNDASDVGYVYIEEGQPDTGTAELVAGEHGDFFLRLFGSDADAKALAQGQTKTIAVRDWPQGNLVGPTKPYILLEGEKPVAPDERPQPVKFKVGATLKGTYELAEAYPNEAWIGLIPWSVTNRGGDKNDAADVAYKYLDAGVLSGGFEFPLEKAGEYVLRLFPCSKGDPNATFQSAKIIVE